MSNQPTPRQNQKLSKSDTADYQQRVEYETGILNSRTSVVLTLNGLGAVAVALSLPTEARLIIALIIMLINVAWIFCAVDAFRFIESLQAGVAESAHAPASEKLRIEQRRVSSFRIGSTRFMSIVIPSLVLLGWIIATMAGGLHQLLESDAPVNVDNTVLTRDLHPRENMAILVSWLVGLGGISLLLGSMGSWLIWKTLHRYVRHTVAERKWKLDKSDAEQIPLYPVLIGIVERLVFTVLVAFQVSGVASGMVLWMVVKMATGWNRTTKRGTAYRMLAFTGLICSLASLSFAIFGGLVASGKISLYKLFIE